MASGWGLAAGLGGAALVGVGGLAGYFIGRRREENRHNPIIRHDQLVRDTQPSQIVRIPVHTAAQTQAQPIHITNNNTNTNSYPAQLASATTLPTSVYQQPNYSRYVTLGPAHNSVPQQPLYQPLGSSTNIINSSYNHNPNNINWSQIPNRLPMTISMQPSPVYLPAPNHINDNRLNFFDNSSNTHTQINAERVYIGGIPANEYSEVAVIPWPTTIQYV